MKNHKGLRELKIKNYKCLLRFMKLTDECQNVNFQIYYLCLRDN